MERPSPKELSEAVGISQPYASMILSDDPDPAKSRTPPRALAIAIFRKLGWRHPVIGGLTNAQIDVLEEVEPWTPPRDRAAAA